MTSRIVTSRLRSAFYAFLVISCTGLHNSADAYNSGDLQQFGNVVIALKGFAQKDSLGVESFAAVLYDGNGAVRDSVVATGNQVTFLNVPTHVDERTESLTAFEYVLDQNYPNPFNPTTRIRLHIPRSGYVTVQIFDILGRKVASFASHLEAGSHEYEWDADVAAGVYFYRMSFGSYGETRKMIKLDGGSGGRSLLREISPGVAPSLLIDKQRSGNIMRKPLADAYSIKIVNLLQTDPQIVDTVLNVSIAPRDTTLRVYLRNGLPRTNLIPLPDSVHWTDGVFALTGEAHIYVQPGSVELTAVAEQLAGILKPSTGFAIPITVTAAPPANGNIYLSTVGSDSSLGNEGYVLSITKAIVTLDAYRTEGLFRGIQTLRQLLPSPIEDSTLQSGIAWTIPCGNIVDRPRFSWRGIMLDVARHFFRVADMKRLIELVSMYKINRLHLHLTDDQGWRIAIDSWPRLTTIGGSTQVDGGAGGYYTRAEYSAIVEYARLHYITVVPEIDMPGHTNAALASYDVLNCSGIAPPLYTGIDVGFSSLCINKDTTYRFIKDVVRELSALTPGPYIHIGGDEASATNLTDYKRFIDSVQAIVEHAGKTMIGWEEVSLASLHATSIAQHWYSTLAQRAAQLGAKVIMSTASRTYLDMKYTSATLLGQNWAGYIEVDNAYSWDPATEVPGVLEQHTLGLEAPLWTEKVYSLKDIEYMAFPRIIGYAEIGWSHKRGRYWDEYKVRLGYHGPRLAARGVNYYKSPLVHWK